ncbi:FecR family protein [Chryseolinea lacunae]|uniref:FecR domain-containing protein n=1 Tax=Chryseolinea lacunae TaxID=2801331 RepID=A0ABS1KL02_9BACT|nr:FecR family protein [Chryseolinea lacunae]MBL0740014.1 FecR domain-containing protein [Chryseolinea lacunae]
MKNYRGYTAEEFASDDDFILWVTAGQEHPSVEAFWKTWMAENPDCAEEVNEARLMIRAVLEERQYMPDQRKQDLVWQRIRQTAQLKGPQARHVSFWSHWYNRAAVIAAIVGFGWATWSWLAHPAADTAAPLASRGAMRQETNATKLPITIQLEDKSYVVLQPQSKLEYPVHFEKGSREVYLEGEAFFQVHKDPERPFLVHANEIVTRVLGTSFTVRSFAGEKDVKVQVKTGKVSVLKEHGDTATDRDAVEGVILTPNQQVVYERREMKMTKSLVENPTVLIPVEKLEFEYADAPVAEVFRAVEEAYGVDIVYDEQVLANCHLNASLTDVSLHDKLKLICKGINATYEVIDSHIVIYGKGCANP